eukprot:TRINITY_DN4429_c0_g1_i1.p1 TRINITY_DN4429_c0_g1~~TRINITY_DN4429_c0_g1_i1.p1  ORF type:complete len:423 (-),score=147.56 TRINITY_DN4429_c0_g1_i1:33-1301(-)
MSEYWVSQDKFYCKYCKVYMQDNAAVKRIHEQGKKHKEKVVDFLSDARKRKSAKVTQEAELKKEIARLTAAADKRIAQDFDQGFVPQADQDTYGHAFQGRGGGGAGGFGGTGWGNEGGHRRSHAEEKGLAISYNYEVEPTARTRDDVLQAPAGFSSSSSASAPAVPSGPPKPPKAEPKDTPSSDAGSGMYDPEADEDDAREKPAEPAMYDPEADEDTGEDGVPIKKEGEEGEENEEKEGAKEEEEKAQEEEEEEEEEEEKEPEIDAATGLGVWQSADSSSEDDDDDGKGKGNGKGKGKEEKEKAPPKTHNEAVGFTTSRREFRKRQRDAAKTAGYRKGPLYEDSEDEEDREEDDGVAEGDDAPSLFDLAGDDSSDSETDEKPVIPSFKKRKANDGGGFVKKGRRRGGGSGGFGMGKRKKFEY